MEVVQKGGVNDVVDDDDDYKPDDDDEEDLDKMGIMDSLDYIHKMENTAEQKAKDEKYFDDVEQEWYE